MENLEATNNPQGVYLPLKKRELLQEQRCQPKLVAKETGKTPTAKSGGSRSYRNCPVEDLEAKNGLQGHEYSPASKKRRLFQEPRSIKPNEVWEETEKTTTGTTDGDRSHRSTRTHGNNGMQSSNELMQALLVELGIINRAVLVLTKKLSETDVNPDQNRLQHPKEDVEKVLFEMMSEGEKNLATREGERDGLRVSVVDRLGRVYHMNFKKLNCGKKYFRLRGPEYHKFVKDNGLKAGDILETWAVRVQRRRECGQEGDRGIMEGELLLVMLNYGDYRDSHEESYNNKIEMILTPSEKEVLDALLLLQKKPVIF